MSKWHVTIFAYSYFAMKSSEQYRGHGITRIYWNTKKEYFGKLLEIQESLVEELAKEYDLDLVIMTSLSKLESFSQEDLID